MELTVYLTCYDCRQQLRGRARRIQNSGKLSLALLYEYYYRLECGEQLWPNVKGKGMVLYSAVSSPLDRSKRFTLSSPGRPVHSDTVLGFSWKHSSHAAIAQRLFTHISTTVYSQVLIYTAESTEASWSERKCPNFETVTTGFEPGLSRLRVRHSTNWATALHVGTQRFIVEATYFSQNLGNFFYFSLPLVSFGGVIKKAVGALYLVFMPGEVKDTICNLLWTPYPREGQLWKNTLCYPGIGFLA